MTHFLRPRVLTDKGSIRYKLTQSQITLWSIILLGIAIVAISLPKFIPRALVVPPIILVLTVLPGGLALIAIQRRILVDTKTLLYAVGLSLILLMVQGMVLNLFLRPLGVERPMSRFPLAVSVSVLVIILIGVMRSSHRSAELEIQKPKFGPVPLALAHIPLLAALSVLFLNRTGNNLPILGVLIALSLMPILLVTIVKEYWHPLGVWMVALGVLYHKAPARSFHFSGNPEVVFAWEAGIWTPGIAENVPTSTELLPLGVLYPSLARLNQIDILTQMVIVNPVLVSIIPVAIYTAARRYVGSHRAVLAGLIFVFAHPFYMQYPPGGRASTPVIFLSLLILLLADDVLTDTVKTGLLLAFSSGVVVSHYGTSYLLLFAIWGGLGLVILFRVLDRILDRTTPLNEPRLDGGQNSYQGQKLPISKIHKSDFLTIPFITFYTILDLSWYLFMEAGEKFHLLPNHIVRAITTLFVTKEAGTGQTATRLQKDYGAASIHLSKRVYLIIGLLMVIGLATIYFRRFIRKNEVEFEDEHIAFATIFLAIFAMTILVPSWGGGRPMMITFVFTTAYATVGATTLIEFLFKRNWKTLVKPSKVAGVTGNQKVSLRTLACILLVLFLLNSGVLAATVFGGKAPSNIPSQELPEETFGSTELDVITHAWVVDNRGSVKKVYGDSIAHGQSDWLNPQIGYYTVELESYGTFKPDDIETLFDEGVPSGYVLLLSHNMETSELHLGTVKGTVPIQSINSDLSNRHIIYTTGYTQVYFANETLE